MNNGWIIEAPLFALVVAMAVTLGLAQLRAHDLQRARGRKSDYLRYTDRVTTALWAIAFVWTGEYREFHDPLLTRLIIAGRCLTVAFGLVCVGLVVLFALS